MGHIHHPDHRSVRRECMSVCFADQDAVSSSAVTRRSHVAVGDAVFLLGVASVGSGQAVVRSGNNIVDESHGGDQGIVAPRGLSGMVWALCKRQPTR